MSELNHPETKLWWIATFEGGVHYGILEPEQCLSYGDKTLTTYDNEADWVIALENNGITLESEENIPTELLENNNNLPIFDE